MEDRRLEGIIHKFMKEKVGEELENQNYSIYYEPLESPLNQLWWHSYRPDVLGTRLKVSKLSIVLVECETKPNRKRIMLKTIQIKKCLSFQRKLHEKSSFLPLLVIPPFNLNKIIYSAIRKFWEIWIINQKGQIRHKIYRIN